MSFLTQAGHIIKAVTGIENLSLLQKKIHKRIGQIIYHEKYNADDIVAVMRELGMHKGSTVCIHAAMREFYNYQGTAEELITKILGVLTPEGTLMMPAFPDQSHTHDKDYVFDPSTEPTRAGLLAETFRKYPGTVRSINVQHSVTAWGKHAEWLTQDHQNCNNCWDEKSPWYRMTELNALNFCLGLPSHYIGTFDHCVEAMLYKEFPYWRQFFTEEWTYRYKEPEGEIRSYHCIEGNLERRTREQRLISHFTQEEHQSRKLSNLLIQVYKTQPCLRKMIELGRKGITMYYIPSTKGYSFEK
ncbi:hypothetical protein PRBRB14_24740 [Hallella multisaccharivorax DSM 17128]|uniref:Aminoglycoside N(3)-acetyltransferase n=1 Tax=Hallella multisaccharivorax DSM 17128 TaxID=688246 RepID=F8N5X9_9BACT|nr:AAC(3) family N-acetyltransferase [Hallella multisaccharivorax]EGN57163.1 aminoglycoside 3-N-acetyltransferase [Hallella multisaccharivorax DSM 17128]GJG31595.1 hypothetical protein PRBRB14_24740 [Hallella multisaccharivorax DSM 17128]